MVPIGSLFPSLSQPSINGIMKHDRKIGWARDGNGMKSSLLLLAVAFLVGCGGSSNEKAQTKLFDATVEPMRAGEWYRPGTDTSWQWQLQGVVNTSYDVEIYDIDLFDADASLIASLKSGGKKVICYFSAGSYENWRSDKNAFTQSELGKPLDGWEGERWLDISSEALAPVMRARLDLAVQKGCDGVEPDNVDGYTNDTGFALSAEDQLAYNKFIANEAHKRGLSVGLKNDVNQIAELESYFDFSLNEQCHAYNECMKMKPFIAANKPVLNAEYKREYVENTNGARDALCNEMLHFNTLILPLNLDDSFRYSCN